MAKKEIINNDAVTLRVGESAAEILEDAAAVTEKTLDIVENTIDKIENTTEKVVTVTKNNPFVVGAALLIGIGIGGFVAYKITQKKLTAEFEAELTEQIAAAKQFHRRIAKTDEFETPEGAVKALVPDEVVEVVQSYQGRQHSAVPYNKPETIVNPPVDVVVEEVKVQQNVFVQASENDHDPRDWDYNAEIADRELNPDQPYTISFDEFNENTEGHEQTTVTYYQTDKALVDAQDILIDNVEYTVGEDNLRRFGHGSGDPNVVYVRNEKIDMDFEIIRDHGSYSKAVFGSDEADSLRHSRRRSPNRRSWRADE